MIEEESVVFDCYFHVYCFIVLLQSEANREEAVSVSVLCL